VTEEKEETEDLLRNTVKEEQLRVRRVVRRLGSKLSGLTLVCGLFVFAFSIYILSVPQDPSLSWRLGVVFAGSLGFVGTLNILCGLLLLLSED
jgi:hypothetical protein